jgi:hypothetical protein
LELGRLLYYQLSKARKNDDELREELNTFIERTTVLRECEYKYRFLDELLFHILKNKVSTPHPPSPPKHRHQPQTQTRVGAVQSNFAVNTKLSSLTSNEAGRIGKSLVMLLMTNPTSGVATDEYVFKYPALEELAAECRWFKPMLVAIAEELMSKIPYVSAGAQEASESSEKKGRRSERKEGRAKRAHTKASQARANKGESGEHKQGRAKTMCCYVSSRYQYWI